MAYDSFGGLSVNTEGRKPSFSVVLQDFTPVATATDFYTLTNPANSNRLIRITWIKLSSTASSATSVDMYLYKRTAANTGGTSASLATSIVYHDTTNPAPVALPASYSVNPTGLGAGNVFRAEHTFVGSTAAQLSSVEWTFGTRPSQAIVLRPGELIAANFNGQTVPNGLQIYLEHEWTEETLSYI